LDRANWAPDIAFVGQTLGPWYLFEPHDSSLAALRDAFAGLDVTGAAQAWPFVACHVAQRSLRLMHQGLLPGSPGSPGGPGALGGLGDTGGLGGLGDTGGLASENEHALLWEFRRLFRGPDPMPAPPWGSVYTDKDCVVFGSSCLELRAWLRAEGIVRQGDGHGPEDHLGELLLLMAWLAESRPKLLAGFLRLHLLTWSSHMLGQLAAGAAHPFYRGLALLTQQSLEGIGRHLGLEVSYPTYYR
jgi:TorA maturation chaperone TorD